jgi:hypothetical protein
MNTNPYTHAMQASFIPMVPTPIEQCCYCWPLLHPDQPYPEA